MEELQLELQAAEMAFAESQEKVKAASYTLKEWEAKDVHVREFINDFLERVPVKWEFSKAMKEAIEFWESDEIALTGAMIEGTMKFLGSLEYKGLQDCSKILQIEEYIKEPRSAYIADVQEIYRTAEVLNKKHDEVDQKNKEVAALSQPESETASENRVIQLEKE